MTANGKYDQKTYKAEIIRRLADGNGWSPGLADFAAQVAVDVLSDHYGGAKQWIYKNKLDYAMIKRQYAKGATVAALARMHCRTARQIRKIVYGR